MKERLSRLDRIYTEELFYFLTFGTSDRRPILANAGVHSSFHHFASTALDRGVFVGRYVIMPDHIHLFAAFDDRMELSTWMKSLKNALSKTLRKLDVSSPHWQKGFFDHLMRHEDSYGSKWDYVAMNPVRHGLVAESSLWPYQGEINALSFH